MLTICIPTYNYDVRPLVDELLSQAINSKIDVEILVADDASTNLEIKQANKSIELNSNVTFIELEKNIGRASIRNLLAQNSTYQHLIFLDCDTFPETSSFLNIYFKSRIEKGVVVGGLAYRSEMPNEEFILRWTYGHERESPSEAQRMRNPYSSFMTGNFLIDKSVFVKLQFDESLKGYGHEDTLFGISLEEKGIQLKHIENRVFHDGLETNEIFIKKSEIAIENLFVIYSKNPKNKAFVSKNSLLKAFVLIKKMKLIKFVTFGFQLNKKRMLANLKSKKPSIRTFDWYKLGLICMISNKKSN